MPARRTSVIDHVEGTKRCGLCLTWKSFDQFYKSKSRSSHGLQCHCIPCSRDMRNANGRKAKARNPSRFLWLSARDRARKNGTQFTITEDDIFIPVHCPVLGILLNPVGRGQGLKDSTPSIDRFFNDIGYTPDNIVVVSWRANRLKSDATPAELRAISDFYNKVDLHAG